MAIVDEQALGGVDAEACEDRFECDAMGLRDVRDALEAEDPRKMHAYSEAGEYAFGMRRRAVGEDGFSLFEGREHRAEERVGGEKLFDRDFVDRRQVVVGVDPVMEHEAVQRGAVGVPVAGAERPGIVG